MIHKLSGKLVVEWYLNTLSDPGENCVELYIA